MDAMEIANKVYTEMEYQKAKNMHGHPGTDYGSVQAIEVDGKRFERVDAMQNSETGQPFDFGKLAVRLAGGENR